MRTSVLAGFELPPKTFLLEAKWQDAKVGQTELLTFYAKAEGKAQWSRGLFVSYSGFSEDGLLAFASGRRTSIVCMDGLDLAHILTGGLDFVEVLQRKKRRAAETGKDLRASAGSVYVTRECRVLGYFLAACDFRS